MTDFIDREELLNNRPEYLNPQMEDEMQSARHRGWNDCNGYYYDLIIKQPKVDTEQFKISKDFARFLTKGITSLLSNLGADLPSMIYENIETNFINGNYKEIECFLIDYIKNSSNKK